MPKEEADAGVYCCAEFKVNYKEWEVYDAETGKLRPFKSPDECAQKLVQFIHPIKSLGVSGAGTIVGRVSPPVGTTIGVAGMLYDPMQYLYALDICARRICTKKESPKWELDKKCNEWKRKCPDGYKLYEDSEGEFGTLHAFPGRENEKPWWSGMGNISIAP